MHSKNVTFRVSESDFEKLSALAKGKGLSPGEYARERALLADSQATESAEDLRGISERLAKLEEVTAALATVVPVALRGIKTLKRLLAVSTTGTLIYGGKLSPEQSEKWVESNLQ